MCKSIIGDRSRRRGQKSTRHLPSLDIRLGVRTFVLHRTPPQGVPSPETNYDENREHNERPSNNDVLGKFGTGSGSPKAVEGRYIRKESQMRITVGSIDIETH